MADLFKDLGITPTTPEPDPTTMPNSWMLWFMRETKVDQFMAKMAASRRITEWKDMHGKQGPEK